MDVFVRFHRLLCAITTCTRVWRSHVWCVMGCLPGKWILAQISCPIANTTQTLSTTYACEVVPTVLRSYVTAYVCMCWGAGILLSSGVVRAMVGVEGDLGWRLPFALQWVWPLPLMLGAYLAPESPWNAVRRNNFDQARHSLMRLRQNVEGKEQEVERTLAYIKYTTQLEKAETANATYLECFKGTNRRRTEIASTLFCSYIIC